MLAQTGLFIRRKFTECLSANGYSVAASEMDLNILQLSTDIAAALQQAQSDQVGLQAYQQGLLGRKSRILIVGDPMLILIYGARVRDVMMAI